MFIYIIILYLTSLINCSCSTLTFRPSTPTDLRRLAVDPVTGTVYVGAVNHLYQLDSTLNEVVDVITGPVPDNKDCVDFRDGKPHPVTCHSLQNTDNHNQVTDFR